MRRVTFIPERRTVDFPEWRSNHMLLFDPKDPIDTDNFRVGLPLATGDTVSSITSITITPAGELTENAGSRVVNTTGVTMNLTGGKANRDYYVGIRFVTAAGLTKERTVIVPVRDL